jgi:hypothetical protein
LLAALARVPARQQRIARRAALGLALLAVALVLARVSLRYDFVLHTPRVAVRGPGGDRPCTTPADQGGVSCGPGEAQRVGPTVIGVDGILHDCVWAPPQPGATTVVTYAGVRLRGRLHVGGGISDETQATGRGAPVLVDVLVDGRRVTTLAVPNGRHWAETDATVRSGVHEVRFDIHAADTSGRALCFDAVAE